MIEIHKNAIRSVISMTIMSVLSASHHIFRLGFTSLPMWMPVILLPLGLANLYRRSKFKQRGLLAAYGVVSYAIIVWFGWVDGLFDHTFRVLGLPHMSWLPGGNVEYVETVFKIGSAETSHWIFQVTGSWVFIASLFAVYFTTRFIWARVTWDMKTAKSRQPLEKPQHQH